MEISKQEMGDVLELQVRGRLDGYWADHLAQDGQLTKQHIHI
jgi:hypothetical protein